MTRDDKQPLIFNLPDGDHVALITWAFVLDQLDVEMRPTMNTLAMVNDQLTRIDTRLKELVK